MTGQVTIFGDEQPLEPIRLGPRQQLVLDELARIHPEPLTADEAGALVHSRRQSRWAHSTDQRCDYCATEGGQVLRRLAQLGHAVRRRGAGGYTLRHGEAADSAQTDEIPF